MGTIVESKADFYSGRMTRKERQGTLVESLLEDHEKKQYLKRKFMAIQEKKKSTARRPKFTKSKCQNRK